MTPSLCLCPFSACDLPFAYYAAAAFDFKFHVAAPWAFHNAGSFRVVAGGTGCDNYTTDLSGLVVVPSTGGWGSFAWLPK